MFEQLKDYCEKDICPMHMPGHKRNTDLMGNDLPYAYDITEISGFDYLHNPKGLIKDIQANAQKLYNCDFSFPLVNGSTCGVLAAISSVVNYGDTILIARNCHKSVYNAIELNGLDVEYVLPDYNGDFNVYTWVSKETIEEAILKNPNIKAVVITSPTYEGFVSDINDISKVVHKFGVPLIVDEAHGAHFGLANDFPKEAVSLGADIAVLGLHKTLPTLTQCALLNVKSELIDINKLKENLAIFQTSSPSYILMSSIDKCISLLLSKKDRLFSNYSQLLNDFYERTNALKFIKVFNSKSGKDHNYFDRGKLLLSTNNCNLRGIKLADILRNEFQIEIEMAYDTYVIAMTSICDTKDNFVRLSNALQEIDKTLSSSNEVVKNSRLNFIPKKIMSVSKAKLQKGEVVDFKKSSKKVSLEYLYAYPPGIPLLVPGELIDDRLISDVIQLKKSGVELLGTRMNSSDKIFVAKDSV